MSVADWPGQIGCAPVMLALNGAANVTETVAVLTQLPSVTLSV